VVRSGHGLIYDIGGDRIVELNSVSGRPLWSYSPPEGRFSSNVVALGELLFFAGHGPGPCRPIYALKAETRKLVWSKGYGSCELWTDGQRLYLQGESGDGIRALAPATGKELWRAEDETPEFVKALVIRGGRIYTKDRIVDAKTGKTILWMPNYPYISSLLPTDDTVFTGTTNGTLNAIDLSNAKERWHSHPTEGYEIIAIVSSDQLVYAVAYEETSSGARARNASLQAFRYDNGQLRWSYPIHSCCQNLDYYPIGEGGGKLFLLTPEGEKSGTKLIALDGETGKWLWTYQSEATLQGPPAFEGERLYVTDSNGGLTALDASTGKSIWKYQP